MKKNLIYTCLLFLVLVSCEKEKDENKKIYTDLNNRIITSMSTDNLDRLYVGTDTGLFMKVKSGFELIDLKIDDTITSLAFDKLNNFLWVGTSQGLAKITPDGSWSNDTIPLENISNKTINSISLNSNSDTWFGTAKGITFYHSGIWQKEKFKKNLSGTITALIFEKYRINSIACWDGDCYFATNGHSIYRTTDWVESADAFSGASQLLYPYNGESLTDTMNVVFIDSKGQQWMGGQNGLQVHVGHDPKMENTTYEDLIGQIVHCIAEDNDGNIWVGTEEGIFVFNGSVWNRINATLPVPFVTAITFENDGTAWIGTKKGLQTLN